MRATRIVEEWTSRKILLRGIDGMQPSSSPQCSMFGLKSHRFACLSENGLTHCVGQMTQLVHVTFDVVVREISEVPHICGLRHL